MINKKAVTVAILGMFILLAGCKQVIYEKLLQGTWEVDEYYRNGVEDTPSFYLLFGDYAITFHPDGYFTETYKLTNIVPITNSGTWAVISGGDQLQLVDQTATRTYSIASLTGDELHLYRDRGDGSNEELVLEPKEERS